MKNVLITGASSGLGKVLAKQFINKNWYVIGWGRNIVNLTKDMEEYIGTYFTPRVVDIKNPEQIEEALLRQNVNIDVLINNASIFSQEKFSDMTIPKMDDIIDTNLKGTIYVTHGVLRHNNLKRIINIASVSALDGIENQTIYSATKAGMGAFSNALSKELSDVYITTIYPGGIDTELWDKDPIGYKGDRNDLMNPNSIFDFIYSVINSGNITVKEITLFPKKEWHP